MKVHCFSRRFIKIFCITTICVVLTFIISFTIFHEKQKSKLLHESSHSYIEGENILYDFTNEKIKNEYIKKVLNTYKDKKVIALTFDDGPSKYTKTLLEILQKHNVHATFFLLGNKAEKNPELVYDIYSSGHLVASHGYSHKIFTKLSEEEIKEEIKLSKDVIENITNTPLKFIRVPYGIISDDVLDILNENYLTSVLWHIDSTDWKLKNTTKIYNKVIKKASNRRIILMHDTYKASVNAVDKIIENLKDEYSFVTVEELMILNTYSKGDNN